MLAGCCNWGGGTRRGNEPVMSAEYGSDDCRCMTGGAAVGAAGVMLGGAIAAAPDDAFGEEGGVLGGVAGVD